MPGSVTTPVKYIQPFSAKSVATGKTTRHGGKRERPDRQRHALPKMTRGVVIAYGSGRSRPHQPTESRRSALPKMSRDATSGYGHRQGRAHQRTEHGRNC